MKDQGLYVIRKDGKNVLMRDGVPIFTSQAGVTNNFGLYVLGEQLEIDGVGVAEAEAPTSIESKSNGVFFGNTKLNNAEGVCINITLEDYNKLRGGEWVEGYKAYDPTEIYNIVADVATASSVTYSIANGIVTFSDSTSSKLTERMVHVSGGLAENSINNTSTATDTKCPFVNVMYFDPIIQVGGKITLEYYVDTQDMASINKDEIGDTFTVIVKTAAGGTPTKKTTYAGRFTIETPAFSTGGETWFSVECIDSNGVGSAVQYFDILVRDAVIPNYYTMVENDLEKYGIVADSDNIQAAYANKAALSNLFAWAKREGYNGIVMLKRMYYIDYHNTFGTQTYKKATIDTSTRTITSIEDCTEDDVLRSGVRRTFKVGEFPTIGDEFADAEANLSRWAEDKWIVDGCIYYVINTSTGDDYIVFPDEFTVDMNECEFRACKCEDLQTGAVIQLEDNFDVHIKNGVIRGNYDRYDFRLGSIRNGTPTPSEHLCATYINKSRFCSLERLDVSYSMGYESCSSGGKWNDITPTFESGRIDLLYGSEVQSSSHIRSQAFDVSGKKEITFGRGSYAGYGKAGTQREIFYSFYGQNGNYLFTTKSKMYFLCKVPAEAKTARLTCFAILSEIEMSTNAGSLSIWTNPIFSKCTKLISCYWHNTRTCALQDFNSIHTLRYDCKYRNIAQERGDYEITPYLGDFEDGWQNCFGSAIIGCSRSLVGENEIMIHFCNSFNFIGNKGISIYNRGGIESGFIKDNQIPKYSYDISFRSIHPFVIYNNNTIGTLRVTYSNDKGNTNFTEDVEKILSMQDSTILTHCAYEYLHLSASKNGDKGFN